MSERHGDSNGAEGDPLMSKILKLRWTGESMEEAQEYTWIQADRAML
jgi:hypothetical protein